MTREVLSTAQAQEASHVKPSMGFGAAPRQAQSASSDELAPAVSPARPPPRPLPNYAIFGPGEAASGARRPVPGLRLQAKLAVGSSTDPLEHEADRVAEDALGPESHLGGGAPRDEPRPGPLTPAEATLSRKEHEDEEQGRAVQ